MNKQTHEHKPMDDLKEWQKHQYDPGYYTGGKVPHWYTSRSNRRPLSIVILISCLIGIGASILPILRERDASSAIEHLFPILGLSVLAVLCLRNIFNRQKP